MAEIIINIKQMDADGKAIQIDSETAAFAIAHSIEVRGVENKKLEMIIAAKLAQTYEATLDMGIQSVIKSLMEGGKL